MLTREEIREHAIIDLINYKGFHRAPCETIVDCVLGSLSLEDVVIRGKSLGGSHPHLAEYFTVESLIE